MKKLPANLNVIYKILNRNEASLGGAFYVIESLLALIK